MHGSDDVRVFPKYQHVIENNNIDVVLLIVLLLFIMLRMTRVPRIVLKLATSVGESVSSGAVAIVVPIVTCPEK